MVTTNSDNGDNSDNSDNSNNSDNSENGDNSDSSQVKMEVSFLLSECQLKQIICLYPETAKEKENARYWGWKYFECIRKQYYQIQPSYVAGKWQKKEKKLIITQGR